MPKILTDDGVQIHYVMDDFTKPWLDSDTIDTIVLTPGFARNLKFWAQWVPTLASKFRVLRYDIRGFGESSVPPKGPYTIERLAKDTLSLIDQLGLKRVHFMGSTSGGFIALQFALSYPERLKSLALVRTPCKFSEKIVAGYSLGYGDPGEAMEKLGMSEWCAKTAGMSRLDPKADPRMNQWNIAEQGKAPAWAAAAWLRCQAALDFRARLPEIKVPTLLMVGDRNVSSPLEQQVFMRQQIPDCRLVVFGGMGGGIEIMMPERCAREALDFFSEIG